MRVVAIIVVNVLFFLHTDAFGATSGNGHQLRIEDVEELLAIDSQTEAGKVAFDKLNTVLNHLKKRQAKYKSEDDFIEYLYYYSHQKLLKKYSEYPTLLETMVEGRYDCLTATAIYSILLSELSIVHNVIETNYHIYIIVNPGSENEMLIETTDPLNGLIEEAEEIVSYRNEYLHSNIAERNTLINLDLNIERSLEQKELIGLLYYNQSIKEINNGHWEKAKIIADQALEYYTESRVSTLLNIIDSTTL